jgi:hypothetical protein
MRLAAQPDARARAGRQLERDLGDARGLIVHAVRSAEPPG